MDYLNAYAYYADIAGLEYNISSTKCGFQINVSGYNHKMKLLLDTIIKNLAGFEVKLDRFSVVKECLLKEYQNFKFTQPYEQALYYLSLILADSSWPWDEKHEALVHLEAEDLSIFFHHLFSRTFLEFYVAGNIEPREAEALVIDIEDILFHDPKHICKPLFTSQYLSNRIVKLHSTSSHYYPVECLNGEDENSALLLYIQVDPDDVVLNVKLELFVLIAQQPAFHQLRTVEQLGYLAELDLRDDFGIHGVQFMIQSKVKDPGHLDERAESFLQLFEEKLHALSTDEFQSNVNALIDLKLEKHKNLTEESLFYWGEIEDGTFKFDGNEAEAAEVKKLTHNDLIEFFNTYIRVGSPQRKKLSVHVYGGQHSAECDAAKSKLQSRTDPSVYRIDDIFSFRRSQTLYGSFKGGFGLGKL